MLFKIKNRFRPLYKNFLKIRENVQNRNKLFKFKNKKWERQIYFYKRRLRRYKKFRPLDQTRYSVSKYPNKWNSYKKKFRSTLNAFRKLRFFYGGLTKKTVKKQIYNVLKKKLNNSVHSDINIMFLELFESRLEVVLYRSKFSFSIRNARQLIVHGKVFVNGKIIKSPFFKLRAGDFITIDQNSKPLIIRNLRRSRAHIWPIPPKHLSIKYKTLEIIFVGGIEQNNLSVSFPIKFNLEKAMISSYRQ